MNANKELMKVVLAGVLIVVGTFVQAMPTREALKKVQSVVNELMAEDVASLKGGKMKPAEVARNAEKYAAESTDEASKFLFYKGAFGLYVQGGAYDEAVRALEKMTREVKDVPDKVMAEIVRDKLKRISRKNGGALFDLYDRLDRRIRYSAEIAALEKKVKGAPTDKALRRQLAVAHVQIGSWPDALKDFAALGGKAAEAVENETKNPAAAADFWWGYAVDEEEQESFREHAAALYRQAIASGKLDGIRLSLAKKRAAEFAPAESDPNGGASVPSSEPTSTTTAATPVPPPPTVGNMKPIVIPLKGAGVRPIEMMPIPTGTMEVGAFGKCSGLTQQMSLTITRPFYMAKLPIDFAQWKAIMGDPHMMEIKVRQGRHSPIYDKLLKCYGGWSAFAVCDVSSIQQRLMNKLNRDYRRYLPPGMIFRQPSLAEHQYAELAGRTCGALEIGDWATCRQLPPKYAWIDEESIRIFDYLEMLKKAGIKVPQFDSDMKDYDVRRELGRELKTPYEIKFLPTGRKKANPWGLCDLYMGAKVLDRFGSDDQKDMTEKEFFDYLCRQIDRTTTGTKDVFSWSEKGPFTFIGRGAFWVAYPGVNHDHQGCIRVVIGPDLVSEWKARQKE